MYIVKAGTEYFRTSDFRRLERLRLESEKVLNDDQMIVDGKNKKITSRLSRHTKNRNVRKMAADGLYAFAFSDSLYIFVVEPPNIKYVSN